MSPIGRADAAASSRSRPASNGGDRGFGRTERGRSQLACAAEARDVQGGVGTDAPKTEIVEVGVERGVGVDGQIAQAGGGTFGRAGGQLGGVAVDRNARRHLRVGAGGRAGDEDGAGGLGLEGARMGRQARQKQDDVAVRIGGRSDEPLLRFAAGGGGEDAHAGLAQEQAGLETGVGHGSLPAGRYRARGEARKVTAPRVT